LDALRREANQRFDGDLWAAGIERRRAALASLRLRTGDAIFDAAFPWAVASNATFRTDEFGPGLWAGLPWFRDNWGRDTFIALPGTLLVSGRFAEARAVLAAFAERQQRDPASPDYGRVPNRVATNQPTIYNTVDGTPWLLRAGLEYVRYSGDVEFADRLIDLARLYIEGAQRHLDAEGLLRHADADTWMDARVYENGPAWSPRGDRAVEIQALWITALESAAELAEARGQGTDAAHWRAQSQRARSAVLKRFVIAGRVADRLRPDGSADLARRQIAHHQPAEAAVADDHARPQFEGGHGACAQDRADLFAAPQMLGGIARGCDPAEVDDALKAGCGRRLHARKRDGLPR
jgi:glycogen debranching enzyme